jgi:CRISPR/Cas system CSM-associated protein Csm2 small subunit
LVKKREIKQITINLKEWEALDIDLEQLRQAIEKTIQRKLKKEVDVFITYREAK